MSPWAIIVALALGLGYGAVAYVSARSGARMGAELGAKAAIEACASHWQCPLRQEEDRKKNTRDLREQYAKLEKEHHDELARVRAAQAAALGDTDGNLPAIPEGDQHG
jgi:hypothetical protein